MPDTLTAVTSSPQENPAECLIRPKENTKEVILPFESVCDGNAYVEARLELSDLYRNKGENVKPKEHVQHFTGELQLSPVMALGCALPLNVQAESPLNAFLPMSEKKKISILAFLMLLDVSSCRGLLELPMINSTPVPGEYPDDKARDN